MKSSTIVILCVLFAAVLGHQITGKPGRGVFKGFNVVNPPRTIHVDNIDARDFEDWEIIPGTGVSKECLVKMDNIAWLVQTNGFRSLCPRQQFGSVLVDFTNHSGSVTDSLGRSCGRILQASHAPKTLNDVTEHAEIDAMRRYAAVFGQGQRANVSFWGNIAVFTPGASCPMDASAIRWGNMRWHIASLSIDDLIVLNFTQIAIEPHQIFHATGSITASQAGSINYVQREVNVQRFGYRNIPANPCPAGCHRPTLGADCTDDVPYVFTDANLIPDLNYHVAPGAFGLNPSPPDTK